MKLGVTAMRAAAAAGLLGVALAPAWGQTATELVDAKHVMIRQRLEPAEPVYVGQPVRLRIEVMTRTWFVEAPKFPETLEVRSAIVIPPGAFGVNSSERIGADTYAVQGRSYTIFPQRTGRFEVPSVSITLVVAQDDASRSPPIQLSTRPVTLEARMPAGAEGHGLVLSTPKLTVSETYSRPTEALEVGDSFDRQVTMTIEDSVGMLLPPVEFTATEGVAVYPGRPEVEDQRNRGEFNGSRVDRATFVMESEGTYELPAVSIWWWNLRTSQLVEEVLPAVELNVGPNPDLAAEHLGEPEEMEEKETEPVSVVEPSKWGWREIGLLALGLLIAASLVRRLWGGWRARGEERAERESEAEAFELFQKAARDGNHGETYSALIRWLDVARPEGGTATARDFVVAFGDETLAQQYQALERTLFAAAPPAGEQPWSGSSFAENVGEARGRWLDREAGKHTGDPLPPMNPVGTPEGTEALP